NLILPSGDVKLGPFDYTIFTNSQFRTIPEIDRIPLKAVGQSTVRVADVGRAEDGHQVQVNVVRVDGQPSVYLPVMRQGGDTNTIAVVDGIKDLVGKLVDVPQQLVASVVFDQSRFVKRAIETLLHEGGIGLVLTGLMVLMFLGSLRATAAVFLSIPLSALAAFIVLYFGGSSINTMILAGFALVFSRLIDNAVIVLENIFRHLEMGEAPILAAERGGEEVSMAVLAATLTSSVVFFPVTFLYGVSRVLFSALALAGGLSLVASCFVACSVVALFCAWFMKRPEHDDHGPAEAGGDRDPDGGEHPVPAADRDPGAAEVAVVSGPGRTRSLGARFNAAFARRFTALLDWYERRVRRALVSPRLVIAGITAIFCVSLAIYPRLGVAFFPRTDAAQFVVNLKS